MLSLCLASGDFYPGLGQSCPLESMSREVRSGSDVLWAAALPVLRNRSSPEPWSGNTDSKTLEFQRTNPREYQIVRTHTKKPFEYKTWHYPTTSSTLCRTCHLNNKQNKNSNPVMSRQDYNLTHPCSSGEKQTNKQKFSTNLTLYYTYTHHWTSLRRAETKRKKEFNLLQGKTSTFIEDWEKETSNTLS